ncbi:hypothetical protein [Desulfothermobacter acidiphilus]|uniref:hypothetical protein n=1 Tax=Desulfothermobacter acidiphilus TaxID=1938353 RepID=UPI003F88917E
MEHLVPFLIKMDMLMRVGYCRVLVLMLMNQIAMSMQMSMAISRMGMLVPVNNEFFFLFVMTVRHLNFTSSVEVSLPSFGSISQISL